MNIRQYQILEDLKDDLKKCLVESFDFNDTASNGDSGEDDDEDIEEIAQEMACDAIRNQLKRRCANLNGYERESEEKRIDNMCVDSQVIVNGIVLSSIRYKHMALAGRDFLIPGAFSEINYGRKNDRAAKYRGCIHWKSVPTHTLAYIKKLEDDGHFSAIRIGCGGRMVAAIDTSKIDNPAYPDAGRCQWDIWIVPSAK